MGCGCSNKKLSPAAQRAQTAQRPAQQPAPPRPRGGDYWQRRTRQQPQNGG